MATQTRTTEAVAPKTTAYLQKEEDSLESPILTAEAAGIVDYARDLAFMAEIVEIKVAESYNPEDTTRLVEISVNGKSYYFLRGEWAKAPRFVLEILATRYKEAWNFGYKRLMDGSVGQTSSSSNILRYPHQYRDNNPAGAKWYDSLRESIH